MKEQLRGATTIYFPDYDLPWVLRTDASDVAIGAVLMQLQLHNGKEQWQPLAFISCKFTDQAKRWDGPKKEAFALFWGVFALAYYLHGKAFVLETDHRNWVYIEKSQVPMIIRWRIYLQSFQIVIRHIPGKDNVVADWMSRMFMIQASLRRLQSRRHSDKDIDVVKDLDYPWIEYDEGLSGMVKASDFPSLSSDAGNQSDGLHVS